MARASRSKATHLNALPVSLVRLREIMQYRRPGRLAFISSASCLIFCNAFYGIFVAHFFRYGDMFALSAPALFALFLSLCNDAALARHRAAMLALAPAHDGALVRASNVTAVGGWLARNGRRCRSIFFGALETRISCGGVA